MTHISKNEVETLTLLCLIVKGVGVGGVGGGVKLQIFGIKNLKFI